MEFTISDQNFWKSCYYIYIINLDHKAAYCPQNSFSLPRNCIGVKIH